MKLAFIAILGASVSYTVYSSKTDVSLSDLALDNVEALANGEYIYSGEQVWERYYRPDNTGYNCSKTGSETC